MACDLGCAATNLRAFVKPVPKLPCFRGESWGDGLRGEALSINSGHEDFAWLQIRFLTDSTRAGSIPRQRQPSDPGQAHLRHPDAGDSADHGRAAGAPEPSDGDCSRTASLGSSTDAPGSPPRSAVSYRYDCEANSPPVLVRAAATIPTTSAGRQRIEPP
jgi:hypothetical protein